MKPFIIIFFLTSFASLSVLSQCEECTPDLTCTVDIPFPTICPLVLPDATAGEEYETVMTFYLPATIVDPDTEIEANLEEVNITSVSGIPFGIAFTLNDENATYFPSNGEEHGCATICGVPLVAGEYEITIQVSVVVVAFGLEQTAYESFILPLTVLPGTAGNALFTIDQIASCGELVVTPESLINSDSGITTHSWNFGNNTTSGDPFPGAQTYSEPGDYTISLQTTIQNYVLTGANIITLGSGWGGDLDDGFGLLNPDPYFIIYDNDGNALYTSPAATDDETPEWTGLEIELSNGPISVDFYDSDGTITDDDFLGTGSFNLNTGTLIVTAGGTTCSFEIELQTTFDLIESEIVSVFETPEGVITANADESILMSNLTEMESYVWLLNGEVIEGQSNDSLQVIGPGMYQVTVSSIFGCSSTSDTYLICPNAELSYNSNTNSIEATEGFDNYIWSFNGLVDENITGSVYSSAEEGNYQVTASNSDGCEVSSNVFTYSGIEEFSQELLLTCYPNPAQEKTLLTFPTYGNWAFEVFDSSGRLLHNASHNGTASEINVNQLPTGVYTIKARNEKQSVAHCRFIKE